MKPFKIELKDGRKPTPEEAEWLQKMNAIINHPENAEPIVERMQRHEMSIGEHFLYWGHLPRPIDGEVCELCKTRWAGKDEGPIT
jgi:hypothetical protein